METIRDGYSHLAMVLDSPRLQLQRPADRPIRRGDICIDPVEASAADLDEIARARPSRVLLTKSQPRAARGQPGARAHRRPDRDSSGRRGLRAQPRRHHRRRTARGRARRPAGPSSRCPASPRARVALHWPERKILVVGDAVIGNPPGRCGLLRHQVMDDPPCLRESVRSLLTIDFDTPVGRRRRIDTCAAPRIACAKLIATFA